MKLDAAGKIDEGNPKLNDGSHAILVYVDQRTKDKPFGLFIIADSFGKAASQLAKATSQLAIETTRQELKEFLEQDDVSEPAEEWLKKKLQLAYERIHSELKNNIHNLEQSKISVMMTAVCVYGELVVIGNVGHIRVYHMHNNNLHQITEDHTLYELVKQKHPELEIQGYMHERSQNILYQTLGENNIEIDIFTQSLVPGDKLLVCNNNIWQKLSDTELSHLLIKIEKPEATVQKVIDAAQEYYIDDLSAIVVEVKAEN